MVKKHVTFTRNGRPVEVLLEPRELLVHVLRDSLAMTGTHLSCETSHCDACTVGLNGQSVKSYADRLLRADIHADADVGHGLHGDSVSEHHPIGAKGVAESPHVRGVPCFSNAVIDAFEKHGVTHVDMPHTSFRVWRQIHALGLDK